MKNRQDKESLREICGLRGEILHRIVGSGSVCDEKHQILTIRLPTGTHRALPLVNNFRRPFGREFQAAKGTISEASTGSCAQAAPRQKPTVLEPFRLDIDPIRVGVVSRVTRGGRRRLRHCLRYRPSIEAQLIGNTVEYVSEEPEGVGSRREAQGENQYSDYNFCFHRLDSLSIFNNLYNLSAELSTRIFGAK